jgi:hypothetical protein
MKHLKHWLWVFFAGLTTIARQEQEKKNAPIKRKYEKLFFHSYFNSYRISSNDHLIDKPGALHHFAKTPKSFYSLHSTAINHTR